MMNADEQPAKSAAAQPEPAAVRADDSFVEALHGRDVRGTETAPVAAELARLVLAWKREIDAEAFPPQLDELTIRRALPPVRVRRRLLTPIAAAAAAVGIALSGVALLAHDAHPGDPLWGVTQVVCADHARSVAAATEAQADLGVAQRALAAGSPEAAHTALERVSSALRSVRDPNLRAKLSAVLTSLRAQLTQETPPVVTATPPPPPAVATVPPVATVATVTVAPKPRPAPRGPGTPSDTPAPTTIPPSSTEPPAPATSPPAPSTAAPTTTMPAPTSAPVTTDSGQPTPAEVPPPSTAPPSAEPTPGP